MECYILLHETDQRLTLVESLVMAIRGGNFHVFFRSKMLKLHAIQQHAAEAMRSHTGKGLGYCYMIGRGLK